MIRALDVATSLASTLTRIPAGLRGQSGGARPDRTLELYEFESCPFCRKVREALTELDLGALVHPCPKGGRRYREYVVASGGKAQFPYLVDPNTGKSLYESDEIVRYLYAQYGSAGVPLWLSLGPVTNVTSSLASAWRLGRGTRYRRAKTPEQPLELWSFEASPYCRIARETLCELELPYRLHNVGKGSAHRAAFLERAGKIQVPYLADPNTGVEIFESAAIVAYLEKTYAEA